MNCIITIERTCKDKSKLRKRIDITSPSRSIDIDEFLGDDDEYRIADAGILQHFAQVNEHESLDDLLELFNSVRQNPYGNYFIYQFLVQNPELLKPEERNRISPTCVVSRYGHLSYGFLKDKGDFAKSAFNHYFPNPRGKLATAALVECIDLNKLADLAIAAGIFGLAEFKDGKCVSHDIPYDVLCFIDEWRSGGWGRRYYTSTSPVWSPDFVYAWATGVKNDFYF